MNCRKILASLAPVLVLFCASSVFAADADIPGLLNQLSSDDAAERVSAAQALGESGEKAPPIALALVKATGDENSAVRRAAIEALRALKPDPELTIPAMVKVLQEAPADVAISIVGVMAEAGESAVPRIGVALEHPAARYWAALVVQDIGPEAEGAVFDILKVLPDTTEEEVRRELILALGAVGPGAKEAVPALAELLDDKDPAVVLAAAYSLGQIGPASEPAAKQLAQNLKSDDEFLAVVSGWSLSLIYPTSKKVEEHVVPVLLKGLTHPDSPGVRAAAAQAIIQLQPDHEVLLPEVLKAVEGSEPEVIMESVAALAAAGHDAVPGLIGMLKYENLRPLVAQVLGQMGEDANSAVPTMVEVLPSSDGPAKRELLMALGKMGEAAAPAVPAIAEAAKSEDGPVRFAAVYALYKIGPAARDAKGAVKAGLDSEDPLFKTLCAATLVRIDPSGEEIQAVAVPLLIEALKHENAMVKIHAADTLALLKDQAKSALPALEEMAADPDPTIAATAQAAIKEIQ